MCGCRMSSIKWNWTKKINEAHCLRSTHGFIFNWFHWKCEKDDNAVRGVEDQCKYRWCWLLLFSVMTFDGTTFDWLCWNVVRDAWNSQATTQSNTSFIGKLSFYSTCAKQFLWNSKSRLNFSSRKTIPIKSHWIRHSIERNCCSLFFFSMHLVLEKGEEEDIPKPLVHT